MDPNNQTQKNAFFVNNMLESSIRIGLLFVLIVAMYDIIKPFIIPVLWGAIIAVALMPMTKRLEKMLKGRRGLAATILTLIAIALLITPFVMISSSIFDAIVNLKTVVQTGQIHIPGPSEKIEHLPIIGNKLYDAWALFATNLKDAVIEFLPQIKSILASLASMLGNSFLTLLMSIISLLIAAGFMANADSSANGVSKIAVRIVGERAQEWTSLIAATIRSVLLGVVGVAFIQSLILGAAFFTFDIPAAGLFALAVLILGIAQLPTILVALPLMIYAFSTMDTGAATIFAIWAMIGGLSDNFLKPMLMGRGVDIPMPVILLGAIGGMLSAGIIGLFLGAVILAIGYELFRDWMNSGQSTKHVAENADVVSKTDEAE